MARITVIAMVVVVLRNITHQILNNGAGSCQAGLPLGPLAQHRTTFPHAMRLEQRETGGGGGGGGHVPSQSRAFRFVVRPMRRHLLRKCSVRASCPS